MNYDTIIQRDCRDDQDALLVASAIQEQDAAELINVMSVPRVSATGHGIQLSYKVWAKFDSSVISTSKIDNAIKNLRSTRQT